MYQMVRPKIAIPVHGEARHLIAHAQLAGECQVQQPLVIQNGDMVRLTSSGAAVVDEVPVGRLASDGKGLLPLGGAALKDRRRGHLQHTRGRHLALDRQGRPVAPPAISLIGMVEPAVAEETMPALRGALERLIDELPAGPRRDDELCATRRAGCAGSSTSASASGRWLRSMWSGFDCPMSAR
jgi:ribonuclease J